MNIHTRHLLVDFRDDLLPTAHPQLVPYLDSGWTLQSLDYRLTSTGAPKLLIKLVRSSASGMAQTMRLSHAQTDVASGRAAA